MVPRRRFIGATAVVTMTLQIVMTAAVALSMCVDRPHTHRGAVATDCAMHHQQAAASETAGHAHQAAAHHAPPVTTRIACRCSSDQLSFLISGPGVIVNRVSVDAPIPAPSLITILTPATLDFRVPPHSPPPRPLPS